LKKSNPQNRNLQKTSPKNKQFSFTSPKTSNPQAFKKTRNSTKKTSPISRENRKVDNTAASVQRWTYSVGKKTV